MLRLGLSSTSRWKLNLNVLLLPTSQQNIMDKWLDVFFRKLRGHLGASIVTGTRYVFGAGVHGWNLMHKLMNVPGVSDLTGSFWLYQKPAFEDIISSYVGKGYVFQMNEGAVKGTTFADSQSYANPQDE